MSGQKKALSGRMKVWHETMGEGKERNAFFVLTNLSSNVLAKYIRSCFQDAIKSRSSVVRACVIIDPTDGVIDVILEFGKEGGKGNKRRPIEWCGIRQTISMS